MSGSTSRPRLIWQPALLGFAVISICLQIDIWGDQGLQSGDQETERRDFAYTLPPR